MSDVGYYVVIFAGRVLHIDNNIVRANTARDRWIDACDPPPDAARVTVRRLPYPPGNITAEMTFAWINSLLSGEVLNTMVDQEVA